MAKHQRKTEAARNASRNQTILNRIEAVRKNPKLRDSIDKALKMPGSMNEHKR